MLAWTAPTAIPESTETTTKTCHLLIGPCRKREMPWRAKVLQVFRAYAEGVRQSQGQPLRSGGLSWTAKSIGADHSGDPHPQRYFPP